MSETPNEMEIEDKNFTYKIKDKDNKEYSVKVSKVSKDIIFDVTYVNSIKSSIYTKKISLEEFQKSNCRYFRMFDTIDEIFDILCDELELEKNTEILIEDKYAYLDIKIQSTKKKEEKLQLLLEGGEIKIDNVVDKLCDKMKEVIELKEKVNELISCFGVSEGVLNNKINLRKEMIEKYSGLKDSSIFHSIYDVNIVNSGISSKLGKDIKNFKLLYKASIDGDEASKFHEKCDNHSNTVTIVQTNTGRRFGGFTTQTWNHSGGYKNESNSFVFSIENKECYYASNSSNSIYCHNNNGPIFGYGYDFYLADKCLTNCEAGCYANQHTYDYKSKEFALTGYYHFFPIDYEVYEIEF